MKIFAVYARLKLINEPKWLNDFIKNAHLEYELHVTFKQPCFIEDNQVDEIKKIANEFFDKIKFPNHKIKVVFDKIYPDSDCECVMIEMTNKAELVDFQKEIVGVFKKYSGYCKLETEEYEKNFYPHLSITLDLDKKTYQKEIGKIPANFQVAGEIKEIVLAIVKENTPAEAKNPKNLTVYKL